MGKKSSDAPPPDPRLVEAQLRSMGVQDAAIGEVLMLAKKQQAANDELMPLQREALQFGLDTGKTAYEQSQSDREWLLNRRGALTDIQDQMITEARDFNTGARETQLVGQAQADAGKAMSDMRQARTRELATMGVMPGSGRSAAVDGLDEARILAGAANQGRFAARQEGRMLTDRVANNLSGYPAAASGVTGQGAAIGAGGVTTANAGVGGVNSVYGAMTGAQQAASGIAGQMGGNATGMYGTQANYKLAADKQASDDGWLNSVATIAGAGASIYAKSAREYKTEIRRVGDHHRLPIGVYTFRYLPQYREAWGDATFLGVMADEVEKVLPAAVGTDGNGYTVVDYSMLN